ncbi:DNA-binding protein [Chimaeribacter arupi]|uniref:ParB/RepB/Spo0J family partition protein n=1 Tax=Chimaeribacter arupi TaxID=2060066 RepID=UPI00271203F2|nr:DNA-binding protein [Chimaeribacter arupi]WKZ94071.1 DNA-binding protein [Chimaeribacter arupi]
MATLNQLYNTKNTDITVRKTFQVPLSELYAEEGYNVREIDQEHVLEFRDAYIAGEFVPPLAVEVTERGVKIIDGHHRYYGALAATEAGTEIPRLECKDFIGSEADKIAFMVTSSQGKQLAPLERAAAYQRLHNQGWSNEEIAKKVKRSVSDVAQHLQLIECGDALKEMIRAGEMSHTTALEIQRAHGTNAETEAKSALEKAKAAGKAKVTKSIAQPQFSAKKSRRLAELLYDAEVKRDEKGSVLTLPLGNEDEIEQILIDYRNGAH